MTLKIIKHYLILLVIFFSWVSFAHADVIINEFVSSPNTNEKEWIELKNNDTKSVDLSGFKLTELSSPTTVPKENNLMSLSGTIDDILLLEINSSSLNDSGDSIGLYNGDILIDRVTYGKVVGYTSDLSAPSKGKSGALISGNWVTNQEPTKNLPNSNSSTNSSDNSSEDIPVDETVDSTSSTSTTEVPLIHKITTKIISPKTVTSGIPFSLSSLTTTNAGETYAVGKFVWNFGDGMVKEVSKAEPFDYTFDYPGEYVVTLSYFDSLLNKVSDATDKMTIKVIPSEIYISSVGDNADPFIEIENKSNYEIVLSNWIVTAGVHYFIIPNGTSILPGKKIKLSPKITGFVGEDIKSVNINDPSNNVVATYPAQQIKTISKSVTVTKPASNNAVSPSVSLPEESQVINLNDLSAEAENSGVNIPKSFYPFLGLIVVIGLGISSFLIIRKRNKENNLSDGRIRAEDIAIIE